MYLEPLLFVNRCVIEMAKVAIFQWIKFYLIREITSANIAEI